MRSLFELDAKNYDMCSKPFIRPSVRGIIVRGNKVCMVHSIKYNYYKFPGGGMEPGENQVDTLIREVAEESGLAVIPESIQEYGSVHRIEKGEHNTVFIQDNYYYICSAEDTIHPQHLDAYEADEEYTLEVVDPMHAIKVNREEKHGSTNQVMLEREARVLELLLAEGYFHSITQQ